MYSVYPPSRELEAQIRDREEARFAESNRPKTKAERIEKARKAMATIPAHIVVSAAGVRDIVPTLVDAYLDQSGASVAQVRRDVGGPELDAAFAAFRRAGV